MGLAGAAHRLQEFEFGTATESSVAHGKDSPMLRVIPRRHSHFVFGVIQSGLTTLIASAIASIPLLQSGQFLWNWLAAWLISWVMMLPVVLFAAPAIRSLTLALTHDE